MSFGLTTPGGKALIATSGGELSEKQISIILNSAEKTAKSKSKIFLEQPTPPYSVGDLWITPDGELFSCTVERTSGEYALGDFVKQLVYTDDTVAKEKRRVFVDEPVPPYDTGDLWLNDGQLYRCFSSRGTGSFSETDWGLATDYTDDSFAKEVEVLMQENVSRIDQQNEQITQTVQSTITTLHNDYLTAEQIASLNEETAGRLTVVEQYQTEQRQLNNRFEFEITNIIDNGVTKVQNTLVTIDENGIHVAKHQDPFSGLLSNEGVYFYNSGIVQAQFTVDGTQINGTFSANGTVRFGGFQIEQAEESGVSVSNWYWIGG